MSIKLYNALVQTILVFNYNRILLNFTGKKEKDLKIRKKIERI